MPNDSVNRIEEDGFSVVLTTASSQDEAQTLAKGLVEGQLVACAQLLPMTSVFRWEGKIQQDAEILLLLKAKDSLYEEIQAFILEHHSYDTPEVIQIPIAKGSAAYLGWIAEESLTRS
jgi:periplasmic divalent cation tolerance protein